MQWWRLDLTVPYLHVEEQQEPCRSSHRGGEGEQGQLAKQPQEKNGKSPSGV